MKIAFLGLGAMGSRMAANLIAAGHDVTVWNRTAGNAAPLVQTGARLALSPREAATGADIIIAMLRDDEASRSVWREALPAMAPRALAIECSTLTPAHVSMLAEDCAARGIPLVDAPLAGSRPQAEARQLIFMAGGTPEDVDRATPVLLAMGSAVHHAGPSGSGAAVKLAINALFGIQVAAGAEIIGSLRRSGSDAARTVEIMAATPVMSPAAKAAAAAMLAGSYAPQFPIALAEKDFGYVEGAATPLATATRAVLQKAIAHGGAGDNITGVMRLYE